MLKTAVCSKTLRAFSLFRCSRQQNVFFSADLFAWASFLFLFLTAAPCRSTSNPTKPDMCRNPFHTALSCVSRDTKMFPFIHVKPPPSESDPGQNQIEPLVQTALNPPAKCAKSVSECAFQRLSCTPLIPFRGTKCIPRTTQLNVLSSTTMKEQQNFCCKRVLYFYVSTFDVDDTTDEAGGRGRETVPLTPHNLSASTKPHSSMSVRLAAARQVWDKTLPNLTRQVS